MSDSTTGSQPDWATFHDMDHQIDADCPFCKKGIAAIQRDTALAQNKRLAQAVEDLTRYTRVTLPIAADNTGRKVVYLDEVLALLEGSNEQEEKS